MDSRRAHAAAEHTNDYLRFGKNGDASGCIGKKADFPTPARAFLSAEKLRRMQKGRANAHQTDDEIAEKEENNKSSHTAKVADLQYRKKIGSSLKKPLPIQADICRLERRK